MQHGVIGHGRLHQDEICHAVLRAYREIDIGD